MNKLKTVQANSSLLPQPTLPVAGLGLTMVCVFRLEYVHITHGRYSKQRFCSTIL